jgi:urate oxidase
MVGHVTAGIKDLLGMWTYSQQTTDLLSPVLKSTGSAFTDFIRDEYTTLAEVDNRILSTSVDVTYTFTPFDIQPPKDEKNLQFPVPTDLDLQGSVWDPEVSERARRVTMEVFANDDSASVQVD